MPRHIWDDVDMAEEPDSSDAGPTNRISVALAVFQTSVTIFLLMSVWAGVRLWGALG
jgi:hypothetical protein